MTRILPTLAATSLLLLLASMTLGLSLGDVYEQPRPESTQTIMRWHFLTGLVAALDVVLVESVIVTYFIGTSRWCKEVSETYQLDGSAVQRSNRLKRKTFPWALAGMLGVVIVIALGGASDPATGLDTRAWANWHLWGAIAGIVLIVWTYYAAWNNVVSNQAIISELVDEVGRIRRERALDPPAAAELAAADSGHHLP